MLVKELNKWDLQREFIAYDRDYYSLEGYEAIVNMFEELGSTQDLDVIGICGDFNESDEDEIRSDYSISEDEEVMDYLNENTYAIELSDSILYQVF